MTLSTFEQIAAITEHSAGFAEASRGNLDAAVEHCPGWSVADLVWHLTEVQWFWAAIADGPLDAPPDESRRPDRAADRDLVDAFKTGALRLVEVLREADQTAHCWTWAGWQQDVAFVTRHQVQEAAVHHWDAAHAAGATWSIGPAVAADCVDEFLHFSVASDDDPDEPTTPPLDGMLALRAADTGDAWTLTDGARPGTALVAPGTSDRAPVVEADAADLLLWLYDRVTLATAPVPEDLLERFRAMRFTD
ncbi:MAG TPA: maleylpyruvate isomerase family mycothiol-dependent enzyme [Nocardioidaceae bacterium]|nr:maleylpyruvate isomerase family mycothiol-dependent enzyme [Nocardioidaceae bacterium]